MRTQNCCATLTLLKNSCKTIWSMQHIMQDDLCCRVAFSMMVENVNTCGSAAALWSSSVSHLISFLFFLYGEVM